MCSNLNIEFGEEEFLKVWLWHVYYKHVRIEPLIMLVVCIYILYLVNRKAFMFVYLMW